jgi:transcriptional regulator with GAF, ATPase, and Fis domain
MNGTASGPDVPAEPLLGHSEAIRRVKALIEQVADTDTAVLISGESGVGKRCAGQALHARSGRHQHPLVRISCASETADVLEGELFGDEREVSIRGRRIKHGKFELAQGGTLFLDEVGELPRALQPKVLRALEERTVERAGGTQVIKVDVRVIATTNVDLARAVSEKRFRRDLYFRLNVFPIHIPPLRERPEDTPVLVQHFLEKFARRMRKAVTGPTAEALRALLAYGWPGNVRELENIIERAVILEAGEKLRLVSVPAEVRQGARPPQRIRIPLPGDGLDLEEILQGIERQLLLDALERSGGFQTRAAELLRISFRSFRHRLRKYGIGGHGGGSREAFDQVGDGTT